MSDTRPDDRLLAEMAALLRPAGEPRAGDEPLAARAIDAALRRYQRVPRPRSAWRRWLPTACALAAALLLAATAAAYLAPRAPRPLLLLSGGAAASEVVRGVAARAGTRFDASAGSEPTPSADAVAVAHPPRLDATAAPRGAVAAAAPATRGQAARPWHAADGAGAPNALAAAEPALPAAPIAETAAQLFARANALRRGGEVAAALDVYRALQAAHPASAEAALSHVSVGRALLDGGGSAAAALAAFDAYLARGGPLAEEALIGRALALARLGRTADERLAWQALLARFPLSVSAARARARLEELP
jgi:hypothetical protein